mmetsp:Transcript_27403/g.38753  ORF Transcript_27403/g.38753 Transcript_27403/m.38753 type:complete len:563 (-) Transcript_27403:45-1733(-)
MFLQALLLLLAAVLFVEPAHVFQSHRLVQFDKNGQSFGSRKTAVNHIATLAKYTGSSTETPQKSEAVSDVDDDHEVDESKEPTEKLSKKNNKDLARLMVITKIEDLSPEHLADIVDRRGAAGVLILIPKDLTLVSQQQLEQWKILERYMVSRSFEVPVYFSVEDESTKETYESLQSHSTSQESVVDWFQVVVNGPEATLLPAVPVHNFQGWHHSAPSVTADTESLPTIAIVANYDTFGAAPGLSFGSDHNGSGAVALLELVRIFSRLYSEFRTHGSYNILFVLTGGGRMNFAGAKHWLKTVDPRLLESLEFALCLEAVGLAAEKLYLHVSKKPKTPEIRNLYNNFVDTAQFMDIPFEVMQWKINISSPFINWQHEQFSRKRILAGTLSGRATPAPVFSAASIFDTKEFAKPEVLERNIKFIAEAVSKQIYGFAGKELEVVKDSLGVSKKFVRSWMQYLGSQPRQAQYTSQNTELMNNIEVVLNKYCADSKKSTFTLDAGFKFYKATSTDMYIYKVKPWTFELMLLTAILAYLLVFHLAVKQPKSWSELVEALSFKKKDSRKR